MTANAEAVRECRAWDWTIPSLTYDKVKEELPVKQQADVMEVVAALGAPIRPGQA